MSYNTTALMCKRLEQDGGVTAGNCNGKRCCWSLTLTRSGVKCGHLPLIWNRSADPTMLEHGNHMIVCNSRSRTEGSWCERVLLFFKVCLCVRVTKAILDILCVSSKPVMMITFPSVMQATRPPQPPESAKVAEKKPSFNSKPWAGPGA